MTEYEITQLTDLLNKYFKNEFNLYKRSYEIVYNDKDIIDDIPKNLFEDVILKNHPYQIFLEKLEQDLIDHIIDVFVLEREMHRFTE